MYKATVIIPCYNAEDSIEKAVLSALRQSIPVQVIVVDDCSTDDSFRILEELKKAEPALTAIRQERNAGPSAARNVALRLVSTPWVAGLDSDDYMLPTRIERLVAHAEKHDVDFVADDVIRVEPGQEPAEGYRVWKDDAFGTVDMGFSDFVRQNIFKYCGMRREISYLKPLMRVEFLRANNIFFREDMRLSEDYEFYIRSLAEGARWQLIDPCGYIAVNREGSLSKVYPTGALERVLDCDRQFLKNPRLTARDRAALREHIYLVRTDYAWRLMIDGARSRQVSLMMRAVMQPLPVMATILLRLAKHFLGLPIFPKDSDEDRKRAGESVELATI